MCTTRLPGAQPAVALKANLKEQSKGIKTANGIVVSGDNILLAQMAIGQHRSSALSSVPAHAFEDLHHPVDKLFAKRES